MSLDIPSTEEKDEEAEGNERRKERKGKILEPSKTAATFVITYVYIVNQSCNSFDAFYVFKHKYIHRYDEFLPELQPPTAR